MSRSSPSGRLVSGSLVTRGAPALALMALTAAQLLALCGAVCSQAASGTTSGSLFNSGRRADAVIVPQQRVYALGASGGSVGLTNVSALVTIIDQVATTRLQIRLKNTSASAAEAQLLIPVPSGAVVRSFDFQGKAPETSLRLLPRDDARREYDAIVGRMRDPALLEFAGLGAIQSSVFPVPPGGDQAVSIVWEQVLTAQGARVDYVLPRSEHLGTAGVPWQIGVRISGSLPISTVYSPSHRARVTRLGRTVMFLELSGAEAREPGSFQISFLRAAEGLSAGVLATPDPDGTGGWFLLLAAAPEVEADRSVAREVLLVIDRSGSMRGRKFEQAVEAARQIIEGLHDGEAFNIIDYSDAVAALAPGPLLKNAASVDAARRYLDLLEVGGGTNLHGALMEAVRQESGAGMLPVVLFLTDGLPTVGVKDEARIGDEVTAANVHRRRLFTFGVGDDVNAPLLDRLAEATRATSTYVHPKQDVETSVGEVYRRLYGPVLAAPRLSVRDAGGELTSVAVRDLQPSELPDLFAEEQLMLLGRYTGNAPVRLELTGRDARGERTIEAALDPALADPEHAFIPRLWAGRRIAMLVDEVRQSGAAPGQPPDDARLSELVQEIIQLSTQFGVLSEYTAFMATEGSTLWNPDVMRQRVRKLLASRAQATRTGRGAVSQARNLAHMRRRGTVDRLNAFLDANMQTIQVGQVRYVDDLAFFRHDSRWIDSRIIARVQAARPDASPNAGAPLAPGPVVVVEFGTEDYAALADRLTLEHRSGVLGLPGEIFLQLDDKRMLIRMPATPAPSQAPVEAPSEAPTTNSDP